MNKVQLLDTIRTKRVRLLKNIKQMREEDLIHRASPYAYSIKDGLAHLTFYEQHMRNMISRSLQNESRNPEITLKERTERNAEIFEHNKDRTLDDVLAEMQASFAEVIALVEIIPEHIWTDETYFRWLNGIPLWQYILDETSGEHYEEHLGALMDGV
ncbi:ClbS/DfsB family four-helix bundle protein [Chloroflexi bacterium TSY]|nr:ClbS/DfsB family four-helix bundle protein [Chloroflexi bacterium TSY]